MGKYWRLWKKGFFYSLIIAVITLILAFIYSAIGISALNIETILEDIQAGTVELGTIGILFLIAMLVGIVIMPILKGWMIEWINKKVK